MKKKEYTHFRNHLNDDEHYYNGLGLAHATKEHQMYLMGVLTTMKRLLDNHGQNYEITPETEVGQSNTLVPDVLVWESQSLTHIPIIVFEIENTQGITKKSTKTKLNTIDKCKKMMLEYPSIQMCYIIDYEKDIWYLLEQNKEIKKTASCTFFKGVKYNLQTECQKKIKILTHEEWQKLLDENKNLKKEISVLKKQVAVLQKMVNVLMKR